jgi:hypothetical protein
MPQRLGPNPRNFNRESAEFHEGLSTVTRQAITKHQRVMEEAGLVRSAWHGRESVWQLEARRLEEALRYVELISKQWDAALDRLRRLVED